MTCTDQLLLLAREYAGVCGLELKTVSWRLFGDTKKLDAIVDGADLQTKRFEAAVTWFSANWPTEATWPIDVPRPAPVADGVPA